MQSATTKQKRHTSFFSINHNHHNEHTNKQTHTQTHVITIPPGRGTKISET